MIAKPIKYKLSELQCYKDVCGACYHSCHQDYFKCDEWEKYHEQEIGKLNIKAFHDILLCNCCIDPEVYDCNELAQEIVQAIHDLLEGKEEK